MTATNLSFSTSEDASHADLVKFLVHAPAGSGKTVLCASLPTPVIISNESGLLSLNKANQLRIYGSYQNIPVITVKSLTDLQDAANFIAGSKHAAGFESVALDSISEMGEVVLNDLLKSHKDPRQAYQRMTAEMTRFIRYFRDLPGKHVYFSAKQEKSADSDGVTRFSPMMPGKALASNIDHLFDEVFALCISPKDAQGNTYRFLRIGADYQYRAKDRSGALQEIEEPNLTKIIAKIQSQNHE